MRSCRSQPGSVLRLRWRRRMASRARRVGVRGAGARQCDSTIRSPRRGPWARARHGEWEDRARPGRGQGSASTHVLFRRATSGRRGLELLRDRAGEEVAQLLRRPLDGILAFGHVTGPFGKDEPINGYIRAMLRRGWGSATTCTCVSTFSRRPPNAGSCRPRQNARAKSARSRGMTPGPPAMPVRVTAHRRPRGSARRGRARPPTAPKLRRPRHVGPAVSGRRRRWSSRCPRSRAR